MNRVDLIGRLTRDPELRRSASGMSILKFTLAVNRARQARPGEPTADFISCTAFGKTADNMARFLHKGSQCAVEGRIETGSYTNQQGQKVWTTDVICDRVEFLDTKGASRQDGYGQDGGYSQGGYGNYSGSGFAAPAEGNPYARSESGFGGGYSAPASTQASRPAEPSAQPDMPFDTDEPIDIASDDLPF